jgi:hypothetical protein
MYPLIEIKTVPISIEMKIKDAQLEYTSGTAEMQISRSDGGLNIKSSPIKVRLDTFEARNSISPTAMRSVTDAAQKGIQSAYAATATYAQKGQLLLDTKVGQELVTQFAQESQDIPTNVNVGLEFLPDTGVDIDWEDGTMQIRYEMDKLNFDWKIDQGQFEFIPGDIEISVEQLPDVIIKYIGGALYVPPSANPNYEPIDVEA